MPTDYLTIGAVPPEEPCVQVGCDDYNLLAREECRRYIKLLRQALGPEPEGANLSIKAFDHDFGTYLEVVCYFDDAKPESLNYALKCEGESPTTWET